MSTLKVNTVLSADTPTVNITDGLNVTGVSTVAALNTTSIKNSTQLGFRRLNINGDMKVAQRATSASVSDGSNEGYSTCDRWYVLHSSSAGGAATWSQDTDVPTDYSWGRFSHSLKADVTTADTSIASNHAITLQYRIEAQDIRNSGWDYTNPNSILSVSFWAKSVKAGIYSIALNSQDGTTIDITKEYTLAANTWKHIELEFPGNSGLTIDNDTGSGLNVLWALVVGSDRQLAAGTWTTRSGEAKYGTPNQVNFYDSTSNNFFLTGVQIEVGKATVFESHRFAEELLCCQRYYVEMGGGNYGDYAYMTGYMFNNGNNLAFGLYLPCAMRGTPTIAVTGNLNVRESGNTVAANSPAIGGYDTNSNWIACSIGMVSDMGSNGDPATLTNTNNAGLTLSAEL